MVAAPVSAFTGRPVRDLPTPPGRDGGAYIRAHVSNGRYASGLGARPRQRPQACADPGGRLQHRAAPAPSDRHPYAPEPAAAGAFVDLPPDRPSDRPLGASDARFGVPMDTDGARRLNCSSPSCLNSRAQRTDFFHGLLGDTRPAASHTSSLNMGHPFRSRLSPRACDSPISNRLQPPGPIPLVPSRAPPHPPCAPLVPLASHPFAGMPYPEEPRGSASAPGSQPGASVHPHPTSD